MSERLIDAVCPHCGVQGTTVRVVLHEDGYTKLSRRCTACGGEWVHTFDHDWLAVAKNKKLQADNERLTSDVALVAERVRQLSDERDYAWADVEKLRADLATQQGCCDGAAAQDAHIRQEREEHRAEVAKLRAEIERLKERLLREQAALVLDEIGAALERERVLRAALTDMLNGWRYIRETYGDLAGVGWDRAEQQALSALEGKP